MLPVRFADGGLLDLVWPPEDNSSATSDYTVDDDWTATPQDVQFDLYSPSSPPPPPSPPLPHPVFLPPPPPPPFKRTNSLPALEHTSLLFSLPPPPPSVKTEVRVRRRSPKKRKPETEAPVAEYDNMPDLIPNAPIPFTQAVEMLNLAIVRNTCVQWKFGTCLFYGSHGEFYCCGGDGAGQNVYATTLFSRQTEFELYHQLKLRGTTGSATIQKKEEGDHVKVDNSIFYQKLTCLFSALNLSFPAADVCSYVLTEFGNTRLDNNNNNKNTLAHNHQRQNPNDFLKYLADENASTYGYQIGSTGGKFVKYTTFIVPAMIRGGGGGGGGKEEEEEMLLFNNLITCFPLVCFVQDRTEQRSVAAAVSVGVDDNDVWEGVLSGNHKKKSEEVFFLQKKEVVAEQKEEEEGAEEEKKKKRGRKPKTPKKSKKDALPASLQTLRQKVVAMLYNMMTFNNNVALLRSQSRFDCECLFPNCHCGKCNTITLTSSQVAIVMLLQHLAEEETKEEKEEKEEAVAFVPALFESVHQPKAKAWFVPFNQQQAKKKKQKQQQQ
ncbi:unnamed protein product [Rotaria magnacalcarata]|uniref:Uncharacterized protein n=1 Tax=Rotaria magnacalcarata TaxID=392030 RepID=A0A815PSE7_9BILA|nr:unnamed protein product [Rotaria magnacalcarata]